jgi:hypothetical protein
LADPQTNLELQARSRKNTQTVGIAQEIVQVLPFLGRHLIANQLAPYKRVLAHVREKPEIWATTQGDFVAWWMTRDQATLEVTVSDGQCHVSTSLEDAVIELISEDVGEQPCFLDTDTLSCPETTHSGPVWITINPALAKKATLIELLKREGILNLCISSDGPFNIGPEDVGSLLDEVGAKMQSPWGESFEPQVRALCRVVASKLAKHHVPLLRVWYHPRINGTVMRAAFSPRFDIDRAITNVARIQALEAEYGIPSTLYVRVFCPFYSEQSVAQMVAASKLSEIALHGEFVTHAQRYGDEMAAAASEKAHLETLTGRPIAGVAMHGGELAFNRSENTERAIQRAGLLYDTTLGPTEYYFPFRRIANGGVSDYFVLPHAMSDVALLPFKPIRTRVNGRIQKHYSLALMCQELRKSSPGAYNRLFEETAITTMEAVYDLGGVFVLAMHPSYFGFLSYITRPTNLRHFVSFLRTYRRRNRQEE